MTQYIRPQKRQFGAMGYTSCFVPKQPQGTRFRGERVIDWIADSISSRAVRGRFSSIARVKGFGAGGFSFGLPRSDVTFPWPFLRWVAALFVMRRTLEGEGVREVSAEDRPREVEGDIGGAWEIRF